MKYAVPIGAAVIIVGGVIAYATMQGGMPKPTSVDGVKTQMVDVSEKKAAPTPSPEQAKPSGTIVDVAIAAGSFKTLVAAVQAADLVETLSGPGPFTVFAPTDEAFAKLPAGTVEGLLKDKEALAKILTYHVVAGKVMAADVVKLSSATTVQGQQVRVSAMNGVTIDDANVITTDIMASNGVIHVIDSVLLPN